MFKNTYHTLVFISFLLISLNSTAQVDKGVSTRLLIPDYQGIITNDYGAAFDDNNDNFAFEAVEVGYYHGLTDAITLGIPVRIGNIKFPNSDADATDYTKQYFLNVGVQGIYKLNNGSILKKDAIFSPYFLAGLGATYLTKETAWTYDIPVGAGLNLRLNNVVNLQAQTEFHLSKANHLMHSLGFYFKINADAPKAKPVIDAVVPVLKEENPTEPRPEPGNPEPLDRDGDGISDGEDKCPRVRGLAKFGGCPDTDSDGIQDADDKCPETAGLAAFSGCPDTDGDGVRDQMDKCPNVKGLASNNGCPNLDTDGDGVNDADDKCPNVAGLASNNGCPNPDRDGDGVPDSADKCPSVKGLTAFGGCPDTDNDGVQDANDKCPTTFGVVSNNGCPEVKAETKKILEFAKRGIKFKTGQNTLTASSYKILDDVAGIMTQNPSYNMSISGYTDSQGKDASNLRLSKNRAKACYDYLVSKGIVGSRMTHQGYGEASPVADNGSKAGRALNRRVEFDIFFSGK